MPISLEFIFSFFIISIIGIIAFKSKALDISGTITSVIIGYLILIGGGWNWLAILLIFFFVSISFTRFRYNIKKSLGTAQEKGGMR
ncbi:MAG: DUF92 domain-containing protein, partial [Nitrososphaeraceae archaeon]|nr:DUF92 domain-containing protein [Nitrososphaeraceae archaeon]